MYDCNLIRAESNLPPQLSAPLQSSVKLTQLPFLQVHPSHSSPSETGQNKNCLMRNYLFLNTDIFRFIIIINLQA